MAYHSTRIWFTKKKYPLNRCYHHFVLGALRKFAERYGDVICWNNSNRSYFLTHGVSDVQWAHYKSPLPEYVYEVYMPHGRMLRLNLHVLIEGNAEIY